MTALACIGGEEVYRQWRAGHVEAEALGPRQTPFGTSAEVFRVPDESQPFYLLPRHGPGKRNTPLDKVNYRANIYALKDLGVRSVLAWGPCEAITHNIAVGDLVLPDDLIDQTHLRPRTFFDDSPLGFLRQFPVFCTTLRQVVCEVLEEMKLVYHGTGVAAVCEGPRHRTPAEVRALAGMGAQIVTQSFAPENFLARELKMCYAPVCYVVSYAETGSRHRPFSTGELFAELSEAGQADRLAGVVGSMSQIARNAALRVSQGPADCECADAMASNIRRYDLPDDWRKWFK